MPPASLLADRGQEHGRTIPLAEIGWRIQAELARLGYKVSARTVAKYMRRPHGREPSPGWRIFLKQHAGEIWACDFISVQTILFRTLYVFFVVRHAGREVLHAQVTQHQTAEWAA